MSEPPPTPAALNSVHLPSRLIRCGPVRPSFGAQIDLRTFQFDFGRESASQRRPDSSTPTR